MKTASASLLSDSITITVDKSHLITIGERLYAESIELVRELVNNAFDADAQRVEVFISDKTIRVKDDGLGMDEEGLAQYFNIGSPFKSYNKKSTRFGRERIGQFGIGKFASLSAASRFEVQTQKGLFAARVIFDKAQWEKSPQGWELPLERLEPAADGDGTTVTLHDVFKQFDLAEVERRIQESVPLRAPHFVVKLNGHQIMTRGYEGHLMPILEGSAFGPIHGEIYLLPASQASRENIGIEVKVKQATIRRELFGMEAWGQASQRVRGEIHADFVPITSDRSRFIEDSPEYIEFCRVMNEVVGKVRKMLGRLEDKTEKRRASHALNEALERVYKALALNPDYSPFGAVPMGDFSGNGKKGAKTSEHHDKQTSLLDPENPSQHGQEEKKENLAVTPPEETPEEVEMPKKLKKPSPTLRKLSPDAVVKKMRVGKMSISCCLDHFGPESPECKSEGTVIFINRDHPLYLRAAKGSQLYTMHIARLLTQEIALMKDPKSPRQAFLRQSKLLKDAFGEG